MRQDQLRNPEDSEAEGNTAQETYPEDAGASVRSQRVLASDFLYSGGDREVQRLEDGKLRCLTCGLKAATGGRITIMSWQTSSFSYGNGQCVETTSGVAQWRKSSYSVNNGQCAEIGAVESLIVARDTTNRSGEMLVFPVVAWAAFVDSLK
jgi:hypothetical protein